MDIPPLAAGLAPYLPVQPALLGKPTLKGERRLVTLFTRSGFVVVKQVETS